MNENLLSPLLKAKGPEPDWHAMEERLITSLTPPKDTPHSRHAPWAPMATAAVVLLAAALTYYPSSSQVDSSRPARPEPSSGKAHDRRLPTPPSSDVSEAARATSAPSHKAPLASRREPAPVSPRAPLDDFMLLPGAASLPEFESGRVVRMAVPITSLPAYGFDVVPDASPGTIDADFLVGQDGIPRAIRLTTYERN